MSIDGFIKRNYYWMNDRLHGSRVRKHFDEIGVVLRDISTGKAIQQERLRQLLHHATTCSEFYKPYHGKEIGEFPVTTKNILNDNHDAVAVAIKDIPEQETEKLHVQRTSGSTGTPFAVYQDSRKRHRRVAELKYFGESVGFKSHEKLGQCRIWTKWHSKSRWQSIKENIIPIDISKIDDESLKEVCVTIKKERIVSLRAYASWYERLVSFLVHFPQYVPCLKSVKVAISISEALNENTRQKMKELTGIPIVECYADEEAGILAHQKTDDINYYLNHAGYYFEVLKLDSDEPAEYGELGRIVLTDLYNYAFPLIRYDTGDTAIFQKGNEKSGGWDYMSKLFGRRLDLIYDTSGNPVHPMTFARVLKNIPAIVQWQFVQKDEKKYCIKLNVGKDVNMDDIRAEILLIVGYDAEIYFEHVSDIPVLASGKRKPVVNEWKNM